MKFTFFFFQISQSFFFFWMPRKSRVKPPSDGKAPKSKRRRTPETFFVEQRDTFLRVLLQHKPYLADFGAKCDSWARVQTELERACSYSPDQRTMQRGLERMISDYKKNLAQEDASTGVMSTSRDALLDEIIAVCMLHVYICFVTCF